jgi:cytochrome P450
LSHNDTERRAIAAPGAIPLLGHTLSMIRDPLAFMTSLGDHGDLVRVRFGPWQVWVVCDPELLQDVLARDAIFDKGGVFYDIARDILGSGLATCPHSEHRRQRRLLQPAFQRSRMPSYAAEITEQITSFLQGWNSGQIIDVPTWTYGLICSAVSHTLFKADSATIAAKIMSENVDDLLKGAYRQMVLPFLAKMPTPGNRRYRNAHSAIRTALSRTISDYRDEGKDYGDLLSLLLAARDDDGSALSDSEILDQVFTMLFAGIETTVTTLTWAMYFLSRDQQIQREVHEEAAAVLGTRTATWADLPALPLAENVIHETLRLYPPAWFLSRKLTSDTELGGYRLTAGSTLMFSAYAIHRRFPDPECFTPSRWQSQIDRHSYVPFGSGARKCIGDIFAITEATLTIASICARWRLQPTTADPASPVPRIIMAPKALRLELGRWQATTSETPI